MTNGVGDTLVQVGPDELVHPCLHLVEFLDVHSDYVVPQLAHVLGQQTARTSEVQHAPRRPRLYPAQELAMRGLFVLFELVGRGGERLGA